MAKFRLGTLQAWTVQKDETGKNILGPAVEAVCFDQNEPKKLAYVETLYLSHMF